MTVQPILLKGQWQKAQTLVTFQATDPASGELLPALFPVSNWSDCEAALVAADEAFQVMQQLPCERIAEFLERYAEEIESDREELVRLAHAETALPAATRLERVELPRTTGQLRAAAQCAREGSWRLPTIDTSAGLRSCFQPLGPVCVFGPNNFPFAFGSISGGDFAAALAAGNPVIAKANGCHPATTQRLAEAAERACRTTRMPPGAVQLLYRTRHVDGLRLVADPRIGATAYTGSRAAGLRLKAAADVAGKLIYLELSSINPVILLPGALRERPESIADEFASSCLLGAGQFCTNPGMVLMLESPQSATFIDLVCQRFRAAPLEPLLSKAVWSSLQASVTVLQRAGARVLVGGVPAGGPGFRFANTLFRVEGRTFLEAPERLQTEAFGNASLLVVASDLEQLLAILQRLEGNLTGSVYSDTGGADDADYERIAPLLRQRVGRLLNDKMPTGVAVSPAMNHGGPYPATGHPGFTAVGVPAALRRFAMLACYDQVRPARLPSWLQDPNPSGQTWRWIDGQWSQQDLVTPDVVSDL